MMENKEYQFNSFFEEIKKEHGIPDYAIGVTFGVDLEKWRTINRAIFGRGFSDKKKFDKAFLFTDKVYIKDTNRYRDLYSGNLWYAIPDVKGYLHTKFVLLCYKKKYVLVLSTKNFNGNGNYDYILPLVFEQDEENHIHGENTQKYINYLIKCSNRYSIPELLKNHIKELHKYKITSTIEGFSAGLFEFAYDGNRFSDDLWKKVTGSSGIVSPYLDETTIKSISNSKEIMILSYPDQINKIENKPESITFRVGKGTYVDGQMVAQRKYHAKLYFDWDENNDVGRMIVGSANLTLAAKQFHCEMLVELITKDKDVFVAQESFINNESWTELYDSDKEYMVLTDDDYDPDDDVPIPIVGDNSMIYIEFDEKYYTAHIVKEKENIVWGNPYVVASYYVVCGQQMLYVDKNRYVLDKSIKQYNGALSYDEYSLLIEERKEKLQRESDRSVLTGKKQSFSDNSGSKRNKAENGVVVEDIPCLYDLLFRNLEKSRNKSKDKSPFVSKEMIIEELTNIRNSLFNEKWIGQIEKMLEKLEIE